MKNWPWFFVSVAVIVIDQLSKYWVSAHLIPYEPNVLCALMNLTVAYNTGAAFSFLHNSGEWHRWFFASFSFVMSVVITIWILRLLPKARLQLIAFSLILGGAVGNLIDRLRVGYVIDFIQVHYQSHYFPIFNLADSAICIAGFILLLDLWKAPKPFG